MTGGVIESAYSVVVGLDTAEMYGWDGMADYTIRTRHYEPGKRNIRAEGLSFASS